MGDVELRYLRCVAFTAVCDRFALQASGGGSVIDWRASEADWKTILLIRKFDSIIISLVIEVN